MKKLILFLLTGFNLCLYSYAQIYSAGPNVYTCTGAVIATLVPDRELNSQELANIDYALFNPGGSHHSYGIQTSDIISAPTAHYNCHAYAWHLTEGNTNQVWINRGSDESDESNLIKYWANTGCFEEVSSESLAEKIYYYTGDHSAVKSSVSGKYESKWGQWYVLRHNPNQVPYTSPNNRRYYRKRHTISGSSAVCPGSSATFTAQNFPGNVVWTCSATLNITANGNTAVVTNNNALNTSSVSSSGFYRLPPLLPPLYLSSEGWVKAEISGTSVFAEKQLEVNNVYITDFNLPSTAPAGVLTVTAQTLYPANVNWSISPANGTIYNAISSNQVHLGFSQNGTFTVTASTTNLCGTYSLSKNIIITGSTCSGCPPPILPTPRPSDTLSVQSSELVEASFTSAYPNPVSHTLTIEINAEAVAQRQIQGNAGSGQSPVFDIRLYDSSGSLRRHTTAQGGTLALDVSNLPSGIYYLNVYCGAGNPPEVHSIIIRN
jgi:hypothetical protein